MGGVKQNASAPENPILSCLIVEGIHQVLEFKIGKITNDLRRRILYSMSHLCHTRRFDFFTQNVFQIAEARLVLSDLNGIWRSLIGQKHIARPRPAAPTIRHDKIGFLGAEAFCFTPPKDPW